MIIQREKVVSRFVEIFVFLFIFTMFNRELIPFGIDLRYIMLMIAMILIGYFITINYKKLYQLFKERQWNVMKYNTRNYLKNNNWLPLLLALFYASMFISTLMWTANNLSLNSGDFKSSIILNGMNLIIILVLLLFKDKIRLNNVITSIVIAQFVLFLSMLLVWKGFHLTQIMGGDYSGLYSGPENHNFLGYELRLAGYAQDPNYASFFMVISGVSSLYFIKNNVLKYGVISTSLLGFLLSASRTVTLGVLLGIVFVLLWNLLNKKYPKLANLYTISFIIVINITPYILIKLSNIIKLKSDLVSMNNRYIMWENALILFEKSPFIGNGLTSFRSFYEMNGGWYVQSHSTIFQLMSEQGILGLIVFALIFISVMRTKGNYKEYLCFVFLVFALTSELVYLSIFPFIVCLLPIINSKCINVQEKKI
ncbi:MAG: O-antigen ligase family protein [Turicibacter sp.]|nr:O-antigen ligase family protein [Turicibacter sp.]